MRPAEEGDEFAVRIFTSAWIVATTEQGHADKHVRQSPLDAASCLISRPRVTAPGDAACGTNRQGCRETARPVAELGVPVDLRKAQRYRGAGIGIPGGLPGAERERLLALCDEQHTPGWFQQHGSRLPLQLVTYIDHESKAVAISCFDSTLVPGLLQTGDYARALLKEAGRVPADEIDARVAARLARQSLFSRDLPAQFIFYLHEFVLRLPVGGPAVMVEQLQQLQRLSRRPYLTLRVVPASLGAHAATAGSFILMEFAEFKPVVYLESETSSLFLEKPVEIAAYQDILESLAQTALGEGESRKLIATLATELSADREDYDARA